MAGKNTQVDEQVDDQSEELNETNDSGTQTRLQALESQAAMASLLADPDIQAVIAARREGKKIKIDEVKDETPKPPKPIHEEIEDEIKDDKPRGDETDDSAAPTNSTTAVKVLAKLIDERLGEIMPELKKVSGRVEQLEGLAQGNQQKEVKTQINAVREKYSDFDKHKAKMLELSKSVQGLTVEELYILAKSRSGGLKLAKEETFSERPRSALPARNGQRSRDEAPTARGRKGFDDLVSEALEGLQDDGLLDE